MRRGAYIIRHGAYTKAMCLMKMKIRGNVPIKGGREPINRGIVPIHNLVLVAPSTQSLHLPLKVFDNHLPHPHPHLVVQMYLIMVWLRPPPLMPAVCFEG